MGVQTGKGSHRFIWWWRSHVERAGCLGEAVCGCGTANSQEGRRQTTSGLGDVQWVTWMLEKCTYAPLLVFQRSHSHILPPMRSCAVARCPWEEISPARLHAGSGGRRSGGGRVNGYGVAYLRHRDRW